MKERIEKNVVLYILPLLNAFWYIDVLVNPVRWNDQAMPEYIIISSAISLLLISYLTFFRKRGDSEFSWWVFILWVTIDTLATAFGSIESDTISIVYPATAMLIYTGIGFTLLKTENNYNRIILPSLAAMGVLIIANVYTILSIDKIYLDHENTIFEFYSVVGMVVAIYVNWKNNLGILRELRDRDESSRTQLEMSNKVLRLIGHNIRTPLTNLSIQLQIAQRSEPKNERYAQLTASVDKLIEITEATIVHNKPISNDGSSIIELINQLSRIYDKRIDLQVSDNAYFYFSEDISKLFLCLQNVLDNAVLCSPKVPPELKINVISNQLIFRINDAGTGMSYSMANDFGSKNGSGLNISGKGIGIHYSIQLVNQAGYNFHMRTRKNVGTQILICQENPQEEKFINAQGWLHKSFYADAKQESILIDLI